MKIISRFFLFVLMVFFFVSCKNEKKQISFYYWKSNAALGEIEKTELIKRSVQSLYVRYFDVDRLNDSIIPLGEVRNLDSLPKFVSIIPVVFITNRTFKGIAPKDINLLVERIYKKTTKLSDNAGININEIQIDCDWSDATRLNYFEFLKKLQTQFDTIEIATTIRLHQIKYSLRTGVPPVKKGVAMIYNIGNIKDLKEKNSILSEEKLKQYIAYLGSYPLQLDIALPIFSWQAHYRKGELIDIIQKDEGIDTTDIKFVSAENKPNYFKINSPFLHNGRYYKKGDQIKVEFVSEQDLIGTAEIVSENLKEGYKSKIIFFDLDENNLKRYNDETFEAIIANFN